jgi:phospholipid-binding lipoprotein MlaA
MPVIIRRLLPALLPALLLAACAAPEITRTINDPYERQNRAVHAFNKQVDRAVLRPLTGGDREGGSGSGPVLKVVGNVASNLDMPRVIVNDVLQAQPVDAIHNSFRFAVNTVFGFGGLLDPAADMGLHARPADFGETLHVWGAAEGEYMELPFLGPSTARDTAGTVVDFFLNPLTPLLPAPERYAVSASKVVAGLTGRAEFGDTVDGVLYDSADSYTQTRLLYLQNRRFRLGQIEKAEEIDPFALDTEGF